MVGHPSIGPDRYREVPQSPLMPSVDVTLELSKPAGSISRTRARLTARPFSMKFPYLKVISKATLN